MPVLRGQTDAETAMTLCTRASTYAESLRQKNTRRHESTSRIVLPPTPPHGSQSAGSNLESVPSLSLDGEANEEPSRRRSSAVQGLTVTIPSNSEPQISPPQSISSPSSLNFGEDCRDGVLSPRSANVNASNRDDITSGMSASTQGSAHPLRASDGSMQSLTPAHALPATTPLTSILNGVEHVTFTYSVKGLNKTYTIRTDISDVSLDSIPPEFKAKNCLYPRAHVPESGYTGNRYHYETDCNYLGWKLAWLNAGDLVGKRGLLQRAVDSYRNRYPTMRSRRVVRQEKLMNGTLRKRYSRDRDTQEEDEAQAKLAHAAQQRSRKKKKARTSSSSSQTSTDEAMPDWDSVGADTTSSSGSQSLVRSPSPTRSLTEAFTELNPINALMREPDVASNHLWVKQEGMDDLMGVDDFSATLILGQPSVEDSRTLSLDTFHSFDYPCGSLEELITDQKRLPAPSYLESFISDVQNHLDDPTTRFRRASTSIMQGVVDHSMTDGLSATTSSMTIDSNLGTRKRSNSMKTPASAPMIITKDTSTATQNDPTAANTRTNCKNAPRFLTIESHRFGATSRIRLKIADLDDIKVSNIHEEFRRNNCVYPRAYHELSKKSERYQNSHRREVEMEMNMMGWKLAWANPQKLANKRLLLQRALDAYRLRFTPNKPRASSLKRVDVTASRKESVSDTTNVPAQMAPASLVDQSPVPNCDYYEGDDLYMRYLSTTYGYGSNPMPVQPLVSRSANQCGGYMMSGVAPALNLPQDQLIVPPYPAPQFHYAPVDCRKEDMDEFLVSVEEIEA